MSQTFIVPPEWDVVGIYTNNPTYTVGSTLNVKWSTSNDAYQVYLWQQSLSQGAAAVSTPLFARNSSLNETRGFAWKIDPDFDLSRSNVFFLTLGPNNTLAGSFVSHYFNLTDATAQTTNGTFQSPSQSSTTPISLILGLALGLGISIILLLAFLAFKVSRRKTRDGSSGPGGAHLIGSHGDEPPLYHQDQKVVYIPPPGGFDQSQYYGRGSAAGSYQDRPYHAGVLAELPADDR